MGEAEGEEEEKEAEEEQQQHKKKHHNHVSQGRTTMSALPAEALATKFAFKKCSKRFLNIWKYESTVPV